MRAWDRSLSKATLPSHLLLRPYLSFFGTLCCRTSGSHLLELTCPRCWDSGQLSLEVLETLPGILYLFDTQHLVLFFVFVFVFHFLAFRCTRCFWARGNPSLLFELHFMGNKISSPDSSAAETNFAEGAGVEGWGRERVDRESLTWKAGWLPIIPGPSFHLLSSDKAGTLLRRPPGKQDSHYSRPRTRGQRRWRA